MTRAAGVGRRGRSLIRRLGYDLVRYPAGTAWGSSIRDVLSSTDADVLLDVGACHGDFGALCRRLGFRGRIVSFEPAAAEAAALEERAGRDAGWSVHRLALGDATREAELFVAATPVLSSLLPATRAGREQLTSLRTIGVERVQVARLDAILDDVAPGARRIFLKIDTQGFDLRVLEGATGVLDRIVAVHVELSLQHFYEGAPDYLEVLAWLRERGFDPVGITPRAVQGALLGEADCLLRRRDGV